MSDYGPKECALAQITVPGGTNCEPTHYDRRCYAPSNKVSHHRGRKGGPNKKVRGRKDDSEYKESSDLEPSPICAQKAQRRAQTTTRKSPPQPRRNAKISAAVRVRCCKGKKGTEFAPRANTWTRDMSAYYNHHKNWGHKIKDCRVIRDYLAAKFSSDELGDINLGELPPP